VARHCIDRSIASRNESPSTPIARKRGGAGVHTTVSKGAKSPLAPLLTTGQYQGGHPAPRRPQIAFHESPTPTSPRTARLAERFMQRLRRTKCSRVSRRQIVACNASRAYPRYILDITRTIFRG
jgi:hypothetical protein